MDEYKLPAGIGPHNFVEYELMAAGTKNLAMFSDLIPSEFLHNPRQIKLGMIVSEDCSCTIYYRHGYKEAAERLLAVNLSSRGKGFVPEIEREIGHLLGYKDWEIDAFLKHVNNDQST